MKPKALICAGLIGLACAISASAQEETSSGAARSVIGFLDPQTGALLPMMTTTSSPAIAAASTAVTGTLKITGTITIISSLPTTTPVTCSATAVVVDANGPISDLVTSSATRSGATATCTMLIPYEWILQNVADNVILSVSVSALTRIHTRQLATFKVPANGVMTSFTFVGHL